MNSGPTSERVYTTLKRLILERRFRPGERLDPARLGEALSSSVTPVRDALHVLVGEGLVGTRTSEGFQLPLIDEPALQDLYAWNAQLLLLAIRSWPKSKGPVTSPSVVDSDDLAGSVGCLFETAAARSGNAEHRRAILRANDRLHAVRLAETDRLTGVEAELDDLRSALDDLDSPRLRKLLAAYHRRRMRAAAEIVRSLYRIG